MCGHDMCVRSRLSNKNRHDIIWHELEHEHNHARVFFDGRPGPLGISSLNSQNMMIWLVGNAIKDLNFHLTIFFLIYKFVLLAMVLGGGGGLEFLLRIESKLDRPWWFKWVRRLRKKKTMKLKNFLICTSIF